MGSFLVDRNQKRCNQPVEMCFLSVNDIILVGSTNICLNFEVFSSLHCSVIFNKKDTSPADLI